MDGEDQTRQLEERFGHDLTAFESVQDPVLLWNLPIVVGSPKNCRQQRSIGTLAQAGLSRAITLTSNRDFSISSSSELTSLGICLFRGASTSLSTSTAVLRLSGSSYSAKPNLHGLSSASVARVHLRRFPAVRNIRSMPSSPPAPSVMPPTNIVRMISSFEEGMSCTIGSRPIGRDSVFAPEPNPALRPPLSRSSRPPKTSEGLDGPEVPSRMTGAEKLMFGIFAGIWKFGGNPLGVPGCCALVCCVPGGTDVPGAATPGGGPAKGQ